ncbi:CFEM domain-containing protein [Colletotrichum plurivorum]|uniref:CFEM domain-containing protein n=1 Tax=Colletotrichum plurivorum TaxID=2175906 RepID=A0A8H6KJ15_9PEZI|nr:CFEM domain-containing protein [Colletotrichum plurivorum]
MKTLHLAVALVAAVAGLASADIKTYPNCAVVCAVDALPKSTCPALDQKCLCADANFAGLVANCIKEKCSITDALNAANQSANSCGVVVDDNRSLPRFLTGILFVLPTVFIGIRIANKIINPSPLGADDYTAFIGYVSVLFPSIYPWHIALRSLDIGLGNPVWTVEMFGITEFFKMLFATQVLYLTGLALVKASIIFFLLRIFPSRGFRRVLWATQVFNGLVGLIYLILTFTMCRPLSAVWLKWSYEKSSKAPQCYNYNHIIITHALINIVLDVWMLLLPLTQLYKLKLVLRKKIGVMMMFSVGVFLVAVSAVRIRTMVKFATVANVTSEALWVYVWTFTELCVGVFVACMPSAGQLWRTLFKKPGATTTAASGESKSRRNSTYATEMASLSMSLTTLTPNSKHRDNSVISSAEASDRLGPARSTHSAV